MNRIDLKKVARLQNTSRAAMLKARQKEILDKMIAQKSMTLKAAKLIIKAGSSTPGLEDNGFVFFYK